MLTKNKHLAQLLIIILALLFILPAPVYATETGDLITMAFDEIVHAEDLIKIDDLEKVEKTEEEVPEDTFIPFTIDEIPLYDQRDYPDTPYSHGTIATSGCGITCAAMLASYYNDDIILPYDLALMFNDLKYSNLDRMEQALEYYECPLIERVGGWEKWDMVWEALENGQPVISLQGPGLFTGGGHFIILTGLTDDGRIMVMDPNGWNYIKNSQMTEKFETGFDEWDVRGTGGYYWIFELKSEANINEDTEIESPMATDEFN